MTTRRTPVQVQSLSNIIAVSAEKYYTIALKNDGTVWSWGTNSYVPVQVQSLSDVVTVLAIGYNVAIKSDGTVWGWGSDGGVLAQTYPAQVSALSNIIFVSGRLSFIVALKNDGTVWTWGNNSVGHLGDGTTTDSTTPVQVLGKDGVGYFNVN